MRRPLLSMALAICIGACATAATTALGQFEEPDRRTAAKRNEDTRIAAKAVAEGKARTDARLKELLAQVPPAAAKDEIRLAIEANLTGHEQALDVLEHARDQALPGLGTEAPVDIGEADTEGLVGARMVLREGARDTQRALKEAMAQADRTSRVAIRTALRQVREANARTLAELDRMRLGRPDRPRNAGPTGS